MNMKEDFMKAEIERLEQSLEIYCDGSRCACCRRMFPRSLLAGCYPNGDLYCEECEDEIEANTRNEEEMERDFIRSR